MNTKKLDKVKINITLPPELVEQIKENSVKECMTMSVYIQVALKTYLDQQIALKNYLEQQDLYDEMRRLADR